MKKILLVVAIACLPLIFTQCNKNYVPEGYELVWQDEFDVGTVPDVTKWTHVVMRQGMVNHELQNYVNHVTPNGTPVTEVKDGTLRINCFKEDGKVYSGRLNGNARTGWQNGYLGQRHLACLLDDARCQPHAQQRLAPLRRDRHNGRGRLCTQ